MNNKSILGNAPSGAEYISKIGYLWNDGDSWFIYEVATEEWLHLFFHEHDEFEFEFDIHSLADIQRIVELENELIAPTDSGVCELDAICERFNSDETSNLTKLVSDVWNKALFMSPSGGKL